MSKLTIKVHEALGKASLLDLQRDALEPSLLAKFGSPGDAKRCLNALADAFASGGELSNCEVIQYFPIQSNVAILMAGHVYVNAVEEFILEKFRV